jgi:hypothetical protein
MAYKNLINASCTDKPEFFCRMRDFICARNGTYDYSSTGIGWTLHDSSYETDEDNPAIDDWYVIYSSGEDTDQDLYFKITYVDGYLKIEGYQSWDSTTHAGSTNKYNTVNNFLLGETGSYTLWIYGNLDYLYNINGDGSATNNYSCLFGKIEPGYNHQTGEVATCSAALTSGSDVSITVDAAPTGWAVGRELFIRTSHNDDMSTVEIEKITIKTISGNVLTADLTNSYTADSKLSDHIGYFCSTGTSEFYQYYALISNNDNINHLEVCTYTHGVQNINKDPDPYEDRYGLNSFWVSSSDGVLGILPNSMLYSSPGTLTQHDVLEEADGNERRYFKIYTGRDVFLSEV